MTNWIFVIYISFFFSFLPLTNNTTLVSCMRMKLIISFPYPKLLLDQDWQSLFSWLCTHENEAIFEWCSRSIGLKLFFSLLFQITAATCDFLSIVKELLQSGADCSIADKEGFRPADVTESSVIKELLNTWNQNHTVCVKLQKLKINVFMQFN